MTTEELIPFDRREGSIWLDGKLVPWETARLHALSHGLHYASCVFEGERVYGGRVFRLAEHTERLARSARILGFELPYSVSDLIKATQMVVEAEGIHDGYVRPVAWRGSEQMGVWAPRCSIHVAIASWVWPNVFSDDAQRGGIGLKTSSWRRPAPNTAPTQSKAAGLYAICTLARDEAARSGFQDALMLDYRGYVAEATGANIFFVQDGALVTPIPDCFLDGITRQEIIAIARELGFPVHERHLEESFLDECREAFLTGTAYEIQPINRIDGREYSIGETTRRLQEEFALRVRRSDR